MIRVTTLIGKQLNRFHKSFREALAEMHIAQPCGYGLPLPEFDYNIQGLHTSGNSCCATFVL